MYDPWDGLEFWANPTHCIWIQPANSSWTWPKISAWINIFSSSGKQSSSIGLTPIPINLKGQPNPNPTHSLQQSPSTCGSQKQNLKLIPSQNMSCTSWIGLLWCLELNKHLCHGLSHSLIARRPLSGNRPKPSCVGRPHWPGTGSHHKLNTGYTAQGL